MTGGETLLSMASAWQEAFGRFGPTRCQTLLAASRRTPRSLAIRSVEGAGSVVSQPTLITGTSGRLPCGASNFPPTSVQAAAPFGPVLPAVVVTKQWRVRRWVTVRL